MGNFMIPTCCICGKSSRKWHDAEWENSGGLQDFCPEHAIAIQKKYGDFTEHLAPHMAKNKPYAKTKYNQSLNSERAKSAQIREARNKSK